MRFSYLTTPYLALEIGKYEMVVLSANFIIIIAANSKRLGASHGFKVRSIKKMGFSKSK